MNLNNLPDNPGCYLFKDKTGKVIYVGKAKCLSKRVKSYFQKRDLDSKTQALVRNIADVEFFVTDNEVEALVLENNLIKKFKPRYNIDLKDSKRYAYIQITEEDYPRLIIARQTGGPGKFYGPFVSGSSRDHLLEALIKIFQIRTCRKMPKKECIRYSIGLCSAPCIEKISSREYLDRVKACDLILRGNTQALVKILFAKMKEASARKDFEKALQIKKQIEAVKDLSEKQKVERIKRYDEDIINYVVNDGRVYLTLFNSNKGVLENKQDFEFEYSPEFLGEFISRYYSENKIPQEIILPTPLDEGLSEYLNRLSGNKIKITVPSTGEKKELLEMVMKNIEVVLFGDSDKIKDLKEKINLQNSPKIIECFDISHLSGTSTVASMVQFRNGRPDKSNYRRFKIKSVEGVDDYASIKEVIRRRYSKLKSQSLELPDLIIVDGGKGQLSSAIEELTLLDVRVPILSIAKREEEIFMPNNENPLVLDKKSKALRFVQEIRDEAHRFAIGYNRLLRKKEIRNDG
jgi:excinuclease ABC subunit C